MNEKYIKSFPNNGGGVCKNSLFRRLMMSSSSSKSYYGNVGDAVFYDSSSNSFVFLPASAITSKVDSYTPIGVVAIPASHDVYGDGTCGVMSLAEMNYSTPDVGSSSYQYMYWGSASTDTSLPNYNKVNLVNGTTADYGYLPSDQFKGATSLDGVSKYCTTSNNAPSPYNADGSRNEAYYTTAHSTANALSDFDGVGNTAVLTDRATGQGNWKTAVTITNSYNGRYYPAACCCWRFHTAGTEQGQWYLPACGEFGYVVNRFNAINETINKILSVYSSVTAVGVTTIDGYGSSSELRDSNAYCLYPKDGTVVTGGKYYDLHVRAFLRI